MRTLQLDWETEQKRGVSYFNQIMEVEKERDQVSVNGLSESRLDSWLTCVNLPCHVYCLTSTVVFNHLTVSKKEYL